MKSRLILVNIGLAQSPLFNGPPLTVANVGDALAISGSVITHSRVDRSTTEETVTACLRVPAWCRDHDDVESFVYSLSVVLRQEAIAWSYSTDPEDGFLSGPHTARWGAFNYDFFIMPPLTPLPVDLMCPGWDIVETGLTPEQ